MFSAAHGNPMVILLSQKAGSQGEYCNGLWLLEANVCWSQVAKQCNVDGGCIIIHDQSGVPLTGGFHLLRGAAVYFQTQKELRVISSGLSFQVGNPTRFKVHHVTCRTPFELTARFLAVRVPPHNHMRATARQNHMRATVRQKYVRSMAGVIAMAKPRVEASRLQVSCGL